MSQDIATATVEVLTAEVRVLMVGSRQITRSVYRQLDIVELDDIAVMGRVNDDSGAEHGWRWVVGRHRTTGALVRTVLEAHQHVSWWNQLPLIVLAGLR